MMITFVYQSRSIDWQPSHRFTRSDLHDELKHRLGSGASVVLGCSALKESYRKILEEGLPQIDFVFLDADQLTLMERLGKRKAHFFPKELLESQFAALERPSDAIVVDARLPFEDVVEQIVNALKATPPGKDG